jgi:curved DNA-binding protein CbpA
MTGERVLIASAFGPSADLYADVLQVKRNATAAELRKAYHRRALLFHPDKQQQQGDKGATERMQLQKATRCFQAVSAAYEILMDSAKRADYDRDGQLHDDDVNTASNHCRKNKNNNNRWDAFFRSVFHEVATAGVQHEASYRGSDKEASDVLQFYKTCKGDLDKVLACVVLATEDDKSRWVRDIIEPAMEQGSLGSFDTFRKNNKKKETTSNGETNHNGNGLVGTDGEGEESFDHDGKGKKRLRKIRSRSLQRAHHRSAELENSSGLVDTDDEEDEEQDSIGHAAINDENNDANGTMRKKRPSSSISNTDIDTKVSIMSKKDKLEYRVAKKQKAKKEKEIELAKLIQGKQWHQPTTPARQPKRPGTFNDTLLSKWEVKYSTLGGGKRKGRQKEQT